MKISLLQLDIQWMNFQANIENIENHLASLESPIELLVLPEMYLTGFNMDAEKVAISEDHSHIKNLIALCKRFNTAIIGSLAIEDEGLYFNRVLILDSSGIIGRYDKQYLYSPSGENNVFSSKYAVNIIKYKGWKILPQVCYDLRFPENIRSTESPDLLIYMANWPQPRINHWDILLQARAIENQCWTIGCNRVGTDKNNWTYTGHSQYVKPDGKVLTAGEKEDHFELELPLETVQNYRSKYPFQSDKKVSDSLPASLLN